MRDLNEIVENDNRRVAASIEGSIPVHQAQGRWVVSEHHGLHFIGFETFNNEADALAKAAKINAQIGQRARIFTPTVDTLAEAA